MFASEGLTIGTLALTKSRTRLLAFDDPFLSNAGADIVFASNDRQTY